MFCTKCGAKIEEGSKFCVKCGTPVNASSVPNTPPTAEAFGGVTPHQSKAPPQQQVMPRKKLPVKPFIIAGSILIVIIVIAIILFIPVFHYTADTRETVDVDVYACGQVGEKAVYWKNRKRVELPYGRYASSINISGNDVYVFGDIGEYPNSKTVYWKNGKLVELPKMNDNDGTFVSSRYVYGNDVYVCGEAYNKAVYWKNGKLVELSSGNAKSIYVSGNDVYVCGNVGEDKVVYWKNGTLVELPGGNDRNVYNRTPCSIYVSGNDVYVAGIISVWGAYDLDLWNIFDLGKFYVVLWKNSKMVRVYNFGLVSGFGGGERNISDVFITKK